MRPSLTSEAARGRLNRIPGSAPAARPFATTRAHEPGAIQSLHGGRARSRLCRCSESAPVVAFARRRSAWRPACAPPQVPVTVVVKSRPGRASPRNSILSSVGGAGCGRLAAFGPQHPCLRDLGGLTGRGSGSHLRKRASCPFGRMSGSSPRACAGRTVCGGGPEPRPARLHGFIPPSY